MSLTPANKDTVDEWLERLPKDRSGEADDLNEVAEIYWLGLEHEIKLRVYQQFEFGGYHDKWLNELKALFLQFPTGDTYDNPIEWDLCGALTPEYGGMYLLYYSYLIDRDEKSVLSDAYEEDDILSDTFAGVGPYPEDYEGENLLSSKFGTALVKVFRLLLRLFVMQNPDLMSNAPPFVRLFFMERESTLVILQYLHECMKDWAKSAGKAAAIHPDQASCQANTAVPSTSSSEGGRS